MDEFLEGTVMSLCLCTAHNRTPKRVLIDFYAPSCGGGLHFREKYNHRPRMKKPGKFANSSFHKEGRTNENVGQLTRKPKTPKDEFFTELVETGRPNWKKAPKAVKQRYNGIYMILVSIPIMTLTGWELYRRLSGKSTKKVQEGEIIEGQEVRKFGEAEKWQREKDSILYKIFGRDFFLDGFTSKTMKTNTKDEKEAGK